MYVQPDSSGLNHLGAPLTAPAVKRAPIAPAQNGDRAQEDRRQRQEDQQSAAKNGAVFRTLLSETTSANLAQALGATPEISKADSSQFIRPEKRPSTDRAPLSNEDVTSAYSFLSSAPRGDASTSSESKAADGQSQQFAEASAAYTKHVVADAHVFAARGEVLELQA